LDYFVTAIKVAFAEDADFQSHFKLEFARGSNKESMCAQVLNLVSKYCQSKGADRPLRVLFCLDNYDALLKPRDGERFAQDYIRQLVRADSNYFFLVLSTSRNQYVPDFASMQFKVPQMFSEPEVSGAIRYFANRDIYRWTRESDGNRNLFHDLVRRNTENNPKAVMRLFYYMRTVRYERGDTFYNDLVECAAAFKNSPVSAENEARLSDYLVDIEQINADEATNLDINCQKLVPFSTFNNIHFNAETISSKRVVQDAHLLFHPFITVRRQHGMDGSKSLLLQFITPRAGARAMELVFKDPHNAIVEVSAFFGNGCQEKYYMGYAGANHLLRACNLEMLDSDELRFYSTRTDMHMLDIRRATEDCALEEMTRTIQTTASCSGIGAVAFHTHAAKEGECGPSKGMDFVLKHFRGKNMTAYIISAPYVGGADVSIIVDSIKKMSINPDYSFKRDKWSAVNRIISGIDTILKTHNTLFGSNTKIVMRLLTSSAAAKNQRWKDLKVLSGQLDFMAVSYSSTPAFEHDAIQQFK
ncbi:hypothetical protein H4R20_003594, partial [Coemansia guatemalensis]